MNKLKLEVSTNKLQHYANLQSHLSLPTSTVNNKNMRKTVSFLSASKDHNSNTVKRNDSQKMLGPETVQGQWRQLEQVKTAEESPRVAPVIATHQRQS